MMQVEGQKAVGAASKNHEVLQAFRLLDVNGDGKICPAELKAVLERMGCKDDSAVQQLIAAADANGDGLIDFEEFLNSSLNQPPAPRRCAHGNAAAEEGEEEDADLRKAFSVFDRNGDGLITAEELQQAMQMLSGDKLSVHDCHTMIARVDVNRDGRVCFSEFKNMMAGVLR